jgi:lysophospholipase
MNPNQKIIRFEAGNEYTEPKAVLLFVHGFGEHAEAYSGFAEFFNGHGYACVAYDQRGHGDLPKNELGIVQNYTHFLDDIQTMRERINEWYKEKPVILYGHSMGGNIALNYLLKRSEKDFTKAIIETPWFRLHENKPLPMILLARLLGFFTPRIAIESKLVMDAISRDPAKVESLKNDGLYHNRMSLRIFTQIMDAGEYVMTHGRRLKLPVLMLCGGDDRIVCAKAIRELSGTMGKNLTFYEEPEGRHVLRDDIEPAKSDVLRRMLDFCEVG